MRKTWLIFAQAVTVALAVLFVVATLKPEWLARNPARVLPEIVSVISAPPTAADSASAPPYGYRKAAQNAAPAVVSITASKAPPRSPLNEDPWFRFFFGQRGEMQSEPQIGLGSGVIVSPEGYLLTNSHVVDQADDIEVQLADGREARATLVGTDPETDLAVLKIELDKLPAITLGDTGQLQVGDIVLAIGNPFNVGQTVTTGIVSALGRSQLGLNTFENFIQTDAAINPGNSGGALVDVNGHLVGINTAIYSRSGGSMGIGFAIPVNTARQVLEGLVRDGQVKRGWIGVEPRNLTPDFAQTFNLPVSEGVLIRGVLRNSPADLAGLQPGDVVTKVGGKPVTNTAQLLSSVADLKPQTEAVLSVQRGPKAIELKVTVGQRPRQALREQ